LAEREEPRSVRRTAQLVVRRGGYEDPVDPVKTVISPIGMSIAVRMIASMRRISVRQSLTRNREWQRDPEQFDDEILAWFEAYRIAMRHAFETNG